MVATGPVLGAWWDTNAGGVRGLYGIAGAAWQGKPSFNDGTYSGATVCMRQQFALLTTRAGALFVGSIPQGTAAAVASQGIVNARFSFSPSCTAAVAYVPGNASALLIQGLPATPKMSSVTLPGGATTAAVSDSGSILVSMAQSSVVAIQLLANGSNAVQPVTTVAKFGGMAFLPGADTALIADQGSNKIIEAAQMGGNPSLTQVAGSADGVAQPVAVAVSADGRSAAVVNQKDSSVIRVDLTGQSAATRAVCHCSPTELEPLAGNLTFRVNEPGAGTVWAYDGDAASPRFVFLPAEQSTQGAQP
ncbi:MAG: hypothetical protein WA869_00200 [Alloacidobacterium sp.]